MVLLDESNEKSSDRESFRSNKELMCVVLPRNPIIMATHCRRTLADIPVLPQSRQAEGGWRYSAELETQESIKSTEWSANGREINRLQSD